MMISSSFEINARGRKRRAIRRRARKARVGNDLPFSAIGSAEGKREAPGRTGQRAPIGSKRGI